MSSILQKANDLIEEYGAVENYFKAMALDKKGKKLNATNVRKKRKVNN